MDHVNGEVGHALVVALGADLFLAWAAIDGDADFSLAWVIRVGPFLMRGAEDGDDGQTEGFADVAGAGIGAEEELGLADEGFEFGQIDVRVVDDVDGGCHAVGDVGGDFVFGWGAGDERDGVVVGCEAIGEFGEAFGQPEFARAEAGTGADDDFGLVFRDVQVGQSVGDGFVVVRVGGESELIAGVVAAEGDGEFGVVVTDGVDGGSAFGLGDVEFVGEKEASAVAVVANALFAPGESGDEGGSEAVLEEDGEVELLLAEQGDEAGEFGPVFFGWPGDDVVLPRFVADEGLEQRHGEGGDFRFWEAFSDGVERGRSHHAVADPCGEDEEDALKAGL